MDVLQQIQTELKAPKGQYNSFGKYKYRSCEDILEAVKPILAKYEAHMTITDEIEYIGDRFYVKAAAQIIKNGEVLGKAVAYAREPREKKGMDDSQITGTASSYARKYALNGLLLIDDTKDADTDENKNERDARSSAPVEEIKDGIITQAHVSALRKRIEAAAVKGKVLEESALCSMFKVAKLEDLKFSQLNKINELMSKNGV